MPWSDDEQAVTTFSVLFSQQKHAEGADYLNHQSRAHWQQLLFCELELGCTRTSNVATNRKLDGRVV